MKIKSQVFNCVENDVEIKVSYEDGKPDELAIGIQGDTMHIIVGYNDMKGIMNCLSSIENGNYERY